MGKPGESVTKHRPSAWRELLGGISRYRAGRGVCHTKMRGKHAGRFCAVFGLAILELGTGMADLGQMLCGEYVPCELFQQTRRVHKQLLSI